MSSRGRRRAPARHAKPKSPARLFGPISFGIVLVLGGSAMAGTNTLAPTKPTPKIVAGAQVKHKVAKVAKPAVKGSVKLQPHSETGVRVTRTVTSLKSFRTESTIIHSAQVERGTKILRAKGIKGTVKYVYRVKVLKGKTISRTLLAKKIVKKAKPAVYIVGTGKIAALSIDAKAAAARTGTPKGNMKFAQVYIAKTYKWNQTQYGCLVSLWNRESHWRHTARNRGSGAYGIPQAMPGSKMSQFGADWRTNPVTQIKWGANYISRRYSTPCGALAHSNSTGWY
ncbi:MAG: G5 domain-containing protein [Actinomycetales bacterium]|nr:G5 domain-containing protein [Actinomycetales bacterium]